MTKTAPGLLGFREAVVIQAVRRKLAFKDF
jgi:hypothetical protein